MRVVLQHFFSNKEDSFWKFFHKTDLFFCDTLYCGKRKLNEIISSINSSDILVLTDYKVSQTKFFRELMGDKYPIFVLGEDCDKALIETAISQAEKRSYQLIIAIGGGSVIDAAKIVAAALGVNNLLEKLLKNVTIKNKSDILTPKRLLVLPTTFGTGSDVNNCTHIHDGNAKISMRHNCFTPWASLTIAEIALELPQKIRYLTALDTWIHAIESHTLKYEVSPLQKILSKEALRLHKKSFSTYIEKPSVNSAVDMATVSCLAGLCLSNSRTGLIHTLATPFATRTGLSHAESLLPFIKTVLEFNWQGIKSSFQETSIGELLQNLDDTTLAFSKHLIDRWTLKLNQQDVEFMVEQCLMDTVIFKENPAPLEKGDLKNLYNTALQQWLV